MGRSGARPYFELDDNHRLDVAGLDVEGGVVIAVEVQRINHDVIRAVPEGMDKMACYEPEEAIWVVMSHEDSHMILCVLNDPPEGPVRVEKTYAATTPTYQFNSDTPGLTSMYGLRYLRDQLLEKSQS